MRVCLYSGIKDNGLVITTEEGIDRAERALARHGFESKTNFAESLLISRSTVTRFFSQKPIQLDSFKHICDGLRLDWKEIVGLDLQEITESEKTSTHIKTKIEIGVAECQTRQISVLDRENKTIKAVITLQGDLDSVSNLKVIEAILKEYSGDTITIKDIERS